LRFPLELYAFNVLLLRLKSGNLWQTEHIVNSKHAAAVNSPTSAANASARAAAWASSMARTDNEGVLVPPHVRRETFLISFPVDLKEKRAELFSFSPIDGEMVSPVGLEGRLPPGDVRLLMAEKVLWVFNTNLKGDEEDRFSEISVPSKTFASGISVSIGMIRLSGIRVTRPSQ
jgi:hypothetical protein